MKGRSKRQLSEVVRKKSVLQQARHDFETA